MGGVFFVYMTPEQIIKSIKQEQTRNNTTETPEYKEAVKKMIAKESAYINYYNNE